MCDARVYLRPGSVSAPHCPECNPGPVDYYWLDFGIPPSYGLAALVWRERLFFRLVPASTDGAMLRTDLAGAFFAVRALRTGFGYAGQMIYGVWSTMDVALMGLCG